ncbi:MAG: helix-turn-helix domain-containing protein [Christensenellaceae bacterium]|jgi:transcriptional regulator with XRE-family HTH domain|nr:helix-turn-helix domain-containing protein [Christensenellaceae bacterium]
MLTKSEISATIRVHRMRAGFTQQQVAEYMGVKQPTIASWERGQSQPDVNALVKLFKFFGSSIVEAFNLDSKEESPSRESAVETELLQNFRALNADGQERVVVYVSDLRITGRYEKNHKLEMAQE